MNLIGRSTILLSGVLAVLAAAATVYFWRRGGRWRWPMRVAGLLAIEIFVVFTIGLIVNRNEHFYPNWEAIFGNNGAETVAPPPVGRLDRALAAGNVVLWSPPEAAGWRLAAAPILIVPLDYARHTDRSYPVIVVLTSAERVASIRAEAAAIADAVTVVTVPTPGTSAAALNTLPTRLAQDARAAGSGWAIVADAAHSTLARQWNTLVPGRFRLVTNGLAAAADKLPPPLNAPVRLHS